MPSKVDTTKLSGKYLLYKVENIDQLRRELRSDFSLKASIPLAPFQVELCEEDGVWTITTTFDHKTRFSRRFRLNETYQLGVGTSVTVRLEGDNRLVTVVEGDKKGRTVVRSDIREFSGEEMVQTFVGKEGEVVAALSYRRSSQVRERGSLLASRAGTVGDIEDIFL